MVPTAVCRWSLCRSQAATTWQSFSARKFLVLLGPIMPQPTTPMVMRFEAEGRAEPAQAVRGMMAAAPAALRKSRRVTAVGEPRLSFIDRLQDCGRLQPLLSKSL